MRETAAADPDRLMSAEEVAEYLGVPLSTIYNWRLRGTGPRAARIGKHLRFRHPDVVEYVETRLDPEVTR
jgi:excisionase family DNA binding protein